MRATRALQAMMRHGLIPGVVAVTLMATMFEQPAFADRDGSTVKRLARLIPAAHYMVGIAHGADAVARFKEHKDNPTVHAAGVVNGEEPTSQPAVPSDSEEPLEP